MKPATLLPLLVTALLLHAGALRAQSLDDALAALKRGEHAMAVKLFHANALRGNAVAQFNLAAMYDSGRGVAQDYAQAHKWYRLAAVQGNAHAQRQLGELYYDGLGVAQDTVRAYQWLQLSALTGDERAAKYRSLVAARMKPAQITQAQNLARECQKNKFAGCD